MKTLEQIKSAANAYISKTSKHLFQTNTGYYYKIETIQRDGKNYYVTIFMSIEKVIVNVQELMSETFFKYNENNSLNLLKKNIFPGWFKTNSIPYFKKMKQLVSDIMGEVSLDNEVNKALTYKYTERLADLNVKV